MDAKRTIVLVALLALAVGCASADGPSNVLLYDDSTALQVGRSALNQLGWSYTVGDHTTLNGLLTGGTSWELVLFDCPSWKPQTGGSSDLGPLTNYVNGGGRAVVSFWDLDQYSGLATALGVGVYQDFFDPKNVYRWDATDPVFSGVTDLTQWRSSAWVDNGDLLTASSGTVALGGFTATAEPNSAAIVRGNSGRTYVNGFLFDDAASSGAGFDNMVQLVANECLLASGREPSADDSPELATWVLLLSTGAIGSALRRRRRA
ncbi:MAG: hypothetical protein AB7Y46_02335 [Armatimonadota bacterium]